MCDDYGGNAPPPVALTHPPPEELRPISTAAALAVLDTSDRPARVERPAPADAPPLSAAAVPDGPSGDNGDDDFSIRIHHVESQGGARAVRFLAIAGVVVVVLAGAGVGLSRLLASDPPPPPPPAPAITVPPAERMARAELNAACPPWTQFAASVKPGDRPDPAAMRPIVDGIRARFDAAAGAVPSYATARDEVGYLQDYSRRDADAIERESVSRVAYAISTVSAACTRAAG